MTQTTQTAQHPPTYQWPEVHRTRLNKRNAGAGVMGTILALLALVLAVLFLMMDSHLLAMASVALVLLFYSAGSQLTIVIADSLKLIFSSKHIDEKSSQILEITGELRQAVSLKLKNENFDPAKTAFKADNDLSRCMSIFLSGQKKNLTTEDFLTYLRTHFYSDAHEHYQYNASCLDFTGNLMPLFGVAGTLYGMLPVLGAMKEGSDIATVSGGMGVAMNATLYGALFAILFKVLASRFKQQIQALNYHFDELTSHLLLVVGQGQKDQGEK